MGGSAGQEEDEEGGVPLTVDESDEVGLEEEDIDPFGLAQTDHGNLGPGQFLTLAICRCILPFRSRSDSQPGVPPRFLSLQIC